MDSKPWWKSVSVWGNVVAILATAGGFFGYVITPENQAAAAIAAQHGAELVAAASALVGEFIGLWGRLRASTRLT
jgi:hypothetical protein